jgi:hypothetical protein
LKFFGFETNPGISVEVDFPRRRFEPGERLNVRVRLLAPLPVRASRLRARFAESPESSELRIAGDIGRFGDLAAVYEADLAVPGGTRGPNLLLIDLLRDEGEPDAVYASDRACGSDDRPIDDRPTRRVSVGRIVRRLVHTVIVGSPPGNAPEMRRGLRLPAAWVPEGQAERVAAWTQEFLPG